MFKLKSLNLNYGSHKVLSDINLEINEGEIVAIVGESGSGKTSLLSQLYAIKPIQVAWCPQTMGLVPSLSAFHNIYAGTLSEHSFLYNLRNLIRPYSNEFQKAEKIAKQLDLTTYLKLSVEQLSGGQKQRVNIARAMIQQKTIFLGDEPVSALDDFQKIKIIHAITAKFSTCIFVLHDLETALTCCQRIIGISGGKIIFDEPVENVSTQQLSSIYSHHPQSSSALNPPSADQNDQPCNFKVTLT